MSAIAYIATSFGIAGVALYLAAKLGIFHHLAVDEELAWQGTPDEALKAALERSIAESFDRDFAAIVAADARRNHPSTRGGE